MGVYIKGMEMPKSCMNCMFCGFAGADCELDLCQITGNAQKHISHSRMPDCPLFEIPPHGRLIDVDELIAKQEEDAEIFMGSTNYGDKVRYDEAMNAVANIVNAPTVIPADKDGET